MSKFRFKGNSHTTVRIGPDSVLVKTNECITVPDSRDGQFQEPAWERIINRKDNIVKDKNQTPTKKGARK